MDFVFCIALCLIMFLGALACLAFAFLAFPELDCNGWGALE